jgi:hypothetical protein
MAVEINIVRKAVEVKWDIEAVGSDRCKIFAENVDTGGVSNTAEMENDGFAVLTYPLDFEGQTHVRVEGTDGGSDEGTITIGAYEAPPDVVEPPLGIWGGGGVGDYIDAGFPADQPEVNPLPKE